MISVSASINANARTETSALGVPAAAGLAASGGRRGVCGGTVAQVHHGKRQRKQPSSDSVASRVRNGETNRHTQGGIAGLGIRETRGKTTMKKALIASTALVLTAGVAAADVTISGYGRTGVIYYENDSDLSETQVSSRLRMNLDAATSTDAGVDFGARFRIQWDQNQDDAGELNAGKLYITASGLTVEIGNTETALDSSGLLYATELGSYDRSVGFSAVTGTFFAYDADEYGNRIVGEDGNIGNDGVSRLGIFAKYEIAGVSVKGSIIEPDQTTLVDFPAGEGEKEYSLAADYTWNERLELSAGYTQNGAGFDDNDIFFVGARYAVLENARIGLNYVDTNDEDDAEFASDGQTFALYGDYTLADGLTNIEAYVANNNRDSNETDNAFGVGVNYDLGGARLGASLQRDYDENVTADMGVRFNF
ncbi:MAG: porin [Paracoccus sp. (in: a-proteobacteria)]|uniref:porin n=1 Tax=Paracoccus sp. TaxID=267 RepID=UPI004059CD82